MPLSRTAPIARLTAECSANDVRRRERERHGERMQLLRTAFARRDPAPARCAFTDIRCPRYLRAAKTPVRAVIRSDSDPVLTRVGHYVQHSNRRPRDTPISENHAVTKLILGMAREEQYLCNPNMIRIVVLYKRIRPSESDSCLHHQRASNCWLTSRKQPKVGPHRPSPDSSGHADLEGGESPHCRIRRHLRRRNEGPSQRWTAAARTRDLRVEHKIREIQSGYRD